MFVANLLERGGGESAEPAEVLRGDVESGERVALFGPTADDVAEVFAAIVRATPLRTFAETVKRVRALPQTVQRSRGARVQAGFGEIGPGRGLGLEAGRRRLERRRGGGRRSLRLRLGVGGFFRPIRRGGRVVPARRRRRRLEEMVRHPRAERFDRIAAAAAAAASPLSASTTVVLVVGVLVRIRGASRVGIVSRASALVLVLVVVGVRVVVFARGVVFQGSKELALRRRVLRDDASGSVPGQDRGEVRPRSRSRSRGVVVEVSRASNAAHGAAQVEEDESGGVRGRALRREGDGGSDASGGGFRAIGGREPADARDAGWAPEGRATHRLGLSHAVQDAGIELGVGARVRVGTLGEAKGLILGERGGRGAGRGGGSSSAPGTSRGGEGMGK